MLIVYDITNKKSFQETEKWYADVQKHAQNDVEIPAILIGNKCDLEGSRIVSIEQASKLSSKKSMMYLETSAKNNYNVENAFFMLINMVHERQSKNSLDRNDKKLLPQDGEEITCTGQVTFPNEEYKKEKKRNCCNY